MDKVLKSIVIDKTNISYTGEYRNIKIIGTPGAKFQLSITNQSDVNKISKNASGYDATTGVVMSSIPSDGVYSFEQYFPSVTASAKYKIKILKRSGSVFGKKFKDYILINQWYPTTLTMTLASASNASSYDSHGSNYGVTNVTIKNRVSVVDKGRIETLTPVSMPSRFGTVTRNQISLDWEIKGASGGDITISRQPVGTDWSNNIADTADNLNNTVVIVKALSNADGGKVKLSSADADLLTTDMVAKVTERGEDIVKRILEEDMVEEDVYEEDIVTEESDADADVDSDYEEEDIPEDVISEETELEGGATTVKEVTISAVDTTNDFVTLSTSQPIRYGDKITFTNGGTTVSFQDFKAVQVADSVIRITATINLLTMGVSDVTSTLALDNFISV